MKYLVLLSFLILVSCNKKTAEDQCAELTDCRSECEFVYQEQEAITAYLSCFDRWGFLYKDQELQYMIGLIPDELDSKYVTDSMSVMICGYARTNTIPLIIADPNIGAVYQTEVVYIEEID